MATKYSDRELFELLKYHCGNDLILNQNLEIRFVRVLKLSKIIYLKNRNPWLLLLFDNNLIDFTTEGIREGSIQFYTVFFKNTKESFLIGIKYEYFENGTKEETRFYLKKISSFLKKALSSKYNIKTSFDL